MAAHERAACLLDNYHECVIHIVLTPSREHVFEIGSTTEAVRVAQALGCRVSGFKGEELPPAAPSRDSPPCPVVFPPTGKWVRAVKDAFEFWDGRTRLGRLYSSRTLSVANLQDDLKTLGIAFFPAPIVPSSSPLVAVS